MPADKLIESSKRPSRGSRTPSLAMRIAAQLRQALGGPGGREADAVRAGCSLLRFAAAAKRFAPSASKAGCPAEPQRRRHRLPRREGNRLLPHPRYRGPWQRSDARRVRPHDGGEPRSPGWARAAIAPARSTPHRAWSPGGVNGCSRALRGEKGQSHPQERLPHRGSPTGYGGAAGNPLGHRHDHRLARVRWYRPGALTEAVPVA